MTDKDDESQSLIPSVPGGLRPTPVARFDYETALAEVQAAMGEALQAMMFSNVPAANAAAQKADAYFLAFPASREPEYLAIASFRALTHVFSLSASVMQQVTELAIREAYETYEQLTDISRQGSSAVASLVDATPEAGDDPDVARLREMFSALVIANEGGRLALEAQEALYRGDVDTYLTRLGEASASLRRVRELPPSLDQVILSLKQQQLHQAERLDRQARNYRLDFFVDPVERFIPATGRKVLIIHGHAEAKWRELRDLLESWGLKSVVLWEEVGAGETIIQKFQRYGNDCCFAFALVTPDDMVEKEGSETYGQARPNVIFEAGWFFGRFGPSRVALVVKKGTELPSDLSGLETFRFSERVEEKAHRIERSLKSLGVLGDS